MRAERIVSHQLFGNVLGKFRIESAADINARQFPMLSLPVPFQFLAFQFQLGRFRIGL